MDPSALIPGRTRETRIRRDARGQWWNGEEPIDHGGVARSFDGWIERTSDGRLCLANGLTAPVSQRHLRSVAAFAAARQGVRPDDGATAFLEPRLPRSEAIPS